MEKLSIFFIIMVFILVSIGCVNAPENESDEITWSVEQSGGVLGDDGIPVSTSTGIKIIFSENVKDLKISEIAISLGGSPIYATLAGSDREWTVSFSVTATEIASVKIIRTGIETETKTVLVYLRDSAPPEIEAPVYDPSVYVMFSDFDDGTCQGIEASGPTTKAIVTGKQFHSEPFSYLITSRTANSHGAAWSQGSYLYPGKTYTFSAWVYHEMASQQNMRLFITVNQGSGFSGNTNGTRTQVAAKQIPSKTWTKIEGDYVVPANGIVFRPSIDNNTSLCDFYVDDISIAIKNGTISPTDVQYSLTPVKEAPVFKQKNLLIGAGIGNTVLSDPSGNRQRLTAMHFNSIAISNSFKAQYIMDYPTSKADMARYNEQVAVDFSITLPYFNFAEKNNLKMSAQALLWPQLTHEWFFHVDYDENKALAGRELMLRRMENYIKDVLEWCQTNYPGMIKMWVVANEAFWPNAADGNMGTYHMRNDLWYQTVGEDYVAKAFEYAKKYRTDPDLDLVYNDFNIESNGTKTNDMIAYIKNYNLKQLGLDAIGFQMHTSLGSAPNPTSMTSMVNSFKKVNDEGLAVYITEMDVDNRDNTSSGNAALKARYKELVTTFLAEDTAGRINLKGISWWCLTDGYTWLTTNKGGPRYPLMFDINNQVKPAYYGVMEAAGADIK